MKTALALLARSLLRRQTPGTLTAGLLNDRSAMGALDEHVCGPFVAMRDASTDIVARTVNATPGQGSFRGYKTCFNRRLHGTQEAGGGGLGTGGSGPRIPNRQSPASNPQSPVPSPQSPAPKKLAESATTLTALLQILLVIFFGPEKCCGRANLGHDRTAGTLLAL